MLNNIVETYIFIETIYFHHYVLSGMYMLLNVTGLYIYEESFLFGILLNMYYVSFHIFTCISDS
jgi:hypothetical protein